MAIIEPTTRQEVALDDPSADRKVPIPPKEKEEDREGKNELVKSSSGKKKKTPGQLRRSEKRREKRLAAEEMRKAATKAGDDIDESVVVEEPKCKHCDVIPDSEEELRAHIESEHKTTLSSLISPEKECSCLDGASSYELRWSPILIQRE